MELEEKVALVTGAGARIGRSVALQLAHEGAVVVIADVDEEAGSSVAREIRSEGEQAAYIIADVASRADLSTMIAFAEDEFGGLDVLVNNAGGVTEPYFPDGEPEHWGRTLDLNLRGVMLSIHFGVRHEKAWRRRDSQRLVHGRDRVPTLRQTRVRRCQSRRGASHSFTGYSQRANGCSRQLYLSGVGRLGLPRLHGQFAFKPQHLLSV